jgi:hypothetical protein
MPALGLELVRGVFRSWHFSDIAGPANDVRSLGKADMAGSCDRNDLPELMMEWTKYHQFLGTHIHPVTFNHGVEGSSPSALTNEIGHNLNFEGFGKATLSALCLQIGCRPPRCARTVVKRRCAAWSAFNTPRCVNRA